MMQRPDKLGKYEVQGVIGRGAVGIVYAAFDPILARPVAVKAISVDLSDERGRDRYARFRREAQAAARMRHPHIVPVYDYGEQDALAYIVMERLEGGSLKDRLSREERPSLPEVRRVIGDLLEALRHSHGQGVVHRDIKPANVVFDTDGNLKITDFGVARFGNADVTREGSALGTPAYMSPEQIKGGAADARSDLYSAGVLLFEMLSGRRPFEGSVPSVMYQIINASAPTLSSLSLPALSAFDPVLARALAKSSDERFESATEMARAVEGAFRRVADGRLPARRWATRLVPARFGAPAVRLWRRFAAARSWSLATRFGWALPAAFVASGVVAFGLWFLLAGGAWRTVRPPAREVAVATVPENASPSAGGTAADAPALAPAGQALQAVQSLLDRETAAVPCSFVQGTVTPGGQVVIEGLTELNEVSRIETAATIRRALTARTPVTSLDWRVASIDGPYCAVFSAIRPIVAQASAASWSASTWAMRAGSQLRVEIAPFIMAVDRFMPNGKVIHLRREEFSAPDSRSKDLSLAIDSASVEPGDLIIAIGSSAAIAPPERPAGLEVSAPYLAALREAIERAQYSGVTILGRIVFVTGGSS